MAACKLFLFTRQGCCLCEGLVAKLRELDLQELSPPLQLFIVDIDKSTTPENLRRRYDLSVPVMALGEGLELEFRELPRVSPRLKGEQLFRWLQNICFDQSPTG